MATKSPASPASTSADAGRRSPITRAEGERRMIAAATALLSEGPFSSVGVRDIAARADVNQGFVHTWFGSRNGLYLRVVIECFSSMLTRMQAQPAGTVALHPLDPEVRFAVRLLIWLELEGVVIDPVKPQLQQLMHAFAIRLVDMEGLDPATADAVALQASAIGMGVSAFGHLLGADEPARFEQALATWRRQLTLLVDTPPVDRG